jgi:general secretion pathway protein G
MRANFKARGRRGGFTLIELMVVIMIMALLGSIVFGITGYASRKAASSRALAQIQQIKNALEGYRLEWGMYLTNSGPMTATWATNLLTYDRELVFVDPWERAYQYEGQGNYQFRLWSYGPDTNNIETRIEYNL